MNKLTLQKISDHVYWMPPAKPDRPSLCAVVGSDRVVMLDAGASSAHARAFLDELNVLGIAYPESVVLTHWHWDHVFGAAEIGVTIIGQELTAKKLRELSKRDWSDAGLEQQIAMGLETQVGAENIKAELPAPRTIHVAQPSTVFCDSFELDLGGVTCQVEHVGGDHARDSSVIFIQPDRVLFLGDCLSGTFYSPKPYYTIQRLIPLLNKIQGFDAAFYVEGHQSIVSTRANFHEQILKMRTSIQVVEAIGPDEDKAFAAIESQTGKQPDEDEAYYLRALITGLSEKNI